MEIREEVGPENFFLFGLNAEQVQRLSEGEKRPRSYYEQNPELRDVLDFISSGALSPNHTSLFRPLVENLLWHDPFLVLADYQSYADCQRQVSGLWRDQEEWTRRAILNTARMGKFSSDRSICEYCAQIWKVQPVVVNGYEELECRVAKGEPSPLTVVTTST